MEYYSSISPLLLSQPSCVETIKNINQQKNINKDDVALKKSSQDFESILINYVIKAMWETVPKSELSDENNAGMDTYTEIMHTALAQDIAAKGGLGIAPTIYKQLMQNKGQS
ncbi:MAG TPA: rod-binding protein [Candidatus Wunengus sp. YC60]|uniref:rod-binding protein n=1 Tax=Candidatus Wunengus sp. YC60 TaxID=3367697 RepID=UPI004026726E